MSTAPQSLLTLDRGNSTLDCLLRAGGVDRRERLDPTDRVSLAALFDLRPSSVVGCSVVPGGLAVAREVAAEHEMRMRVAGEDLPCPIKLRYDDPKSLGVDRWVGAFAAHRDHGAAVIVDCGSAVTVDAVGADGVFYGGVIAPGLQAMSSGLAAATPHLPEADPNREVVLVPTNTADALAAGLQLGFCGAVERLIAEVARAAGQDDSRVVITGGDAEALVRHLGIEAIHVPDLVHLGLGYLSESGGAGRE